MSRRVLIVDDSRTVREVLHSTLTAAGYQVCSAGSGPEALDLVNKNNYDLLMSDLNMPEMGGAEFISHVRKIPGQRFVPIVILSGECKQANFKECSKAGASGFLQKPFDKEKVLSVLKMIIPY